MVDFWHFWPRTWELDLDHIPFLDPDNWPKDQGANSMGGFSSGFQAVFLAYWIGTLDPTFQIPNSQKDPDSWFGFSRSLTRPPMASVRQTSFTARCRNEDCLLLTRRSSKNPFVSHTTHKNHKRALLSISLPRPPPSARFSEGGREIERGGIFEAFASSAL